MYIGHSAESKMKSRSDLDRKHPYRASLLNRRTHLGSIPNDTLR